MTKTNQTQAGERTQDTATTAQFPVHFRDLRYDGIISGEGVAMVSGINLTDAILQYQSANPQLVVNRQLVSRREAREAGYKFTPQSEDREALI